MTDYITEQEQIQQLKLWVKQYGLTIILGILVAVLMTSGWRFWQNRQNKILTHASQIFDEMMVMRSQNNISSETALADKLLQRYAKTPYASFAAMILAREAVSKKQYDIALQQLNWVIEHSKVDSIKTIAQTRLARIYIQQKKFDVALQSLSNIDDPNFIGLAEEIRGDAYVAKNEKKAARQAYQQALKALPNAEVSRPLLQMKYDNLAV